MDNFVYVLNQRGKALMPCSPCKGKKLLKEGKAKVISRSPFTIQLTIATGETKQNITLGIDSGYLHIGLSAITEKKELFSASVMLRKDIVKLNSGRKSYRRCRRSRKTWYREVKFLNRKKEEGWLAPSLQHKESSHKRIIEKLEKILPVTDIVIEVASFDIQKIKNPDIEGVAYQNGEQKGFWNEREYVLYRDGHTCRHCKGKSKDKILETHHLESRQRSKPYSIIQHRRHNRSLQTNRNGFKPSIRKKKYPYQPGDRVRLAGDIWTVKGVFNYGDWVRLKDGNGKIKNLATKKIELLKYGRGFSFEY